MKSLSDYTFLYSSDFWKHDNVSHMQIKKVIILNNNGETILKMKCKKEQNNWHILGELHNSNDGRGKVTNKTLSTVINLYTLN